MKIENLPISASSSDQRSVLPVLIFPATTHKNNLDNFGCLTKTYVKSKIWLHSFQVLQESEY